MCAGAAGCEITGEKSLWIQLKKKKSLSLIVRFDLYAFAGIIVGCKPIFSTKIWDVYVYSYLPCCSRAAANAEHSLSFLSDTTAVRQGTWHSGYLSPSYLQSLIYYCFSISSVQVSPPCSALSVKYEQRYRHSPWTTPEIWDAFPFFIWSKLFSLSAFCLSLYCVFIYLFIYFYIHAIVISKSCRV